MVVLSTHRLPLQPVHDMGLIDIVERIMSSGGQQKMVLDHLLLVFEPLHGVGLVHPHLSLQAWAPAHTGKGEGQ